MFGCKARMETVRPNCAYPGTALKIVTALNLVTGRRTQHCLPIPDSIDDEDCVASGTGGGTWHSPGSGTCCTAPPPY